MTRPGKALRCLALAVLGSFELPYAYTAAAQEIPAPEAETSASVRLEPLRCWRKAEKSFVRIGEPFRLVLTCEIPETAEVKTVLSEAALEPEAVNANPYEITGGYRRETEREKADWRIRLLQYEYAMRLPVKGEYIGKDVPSRNWKFITVSNKNLKKKQLCNRGTGSIFCRRFRFVSRPLYRATPGTFLMPAWTRSGLLQRGGRGPMRRSGLPFSYFSCLLLSS